MSGAPKDLDLLLTEANELLRSAYAIVLREGEETNWPAFQRKVFDALVRQNMALRGTAHPDAAVATAKTFRLPKDDETLANEADLLTVLQRYVAAYPAFRMKPIGEPGSPARIEQENLMALEATAQAAIHRARSAA